MNEGLYQRYIDSVKESCEKYIETKDLSSFDHYISDTSRIFEGNRAIFVGEYDIVSTNYQGYFGDNNLCTVVARILLKEKNCTTTDCILLDASVSCYYEDNTIFYESVRVGFAKKYAYQDLNDEGDMLKYKKVLTYMHDLIMEYDLKNSNFIYDKQAYKDFFHLDTDYKIMDEWFWDFCSYYVHEEDKEKLDMFRDIDLIKRIQHNDLVFQTHVRVRRDNEYIWIKLIFVLIPGTDGVPVDRIFILIQDYSSAMTERMTNLMYARIDALTQTWNRRHSEELISSRIKSNGNGLFAIFDVDDFKIVNDTFGHITGDQLLRKISHTVSESITDNDVFGRLGGDEFILYLKGDFNDCLTQFLSILGKLRFNYYENDKKISIACSAGVARVNGRRTSFNELYESADAALYDAKRSGKGIHKISMASMIDDEDDDE